jgi:hypothetical protein
VTPDVRAPVVRGRYGVDQTIAQANLDLAAFDDEQIFRRIASAENNVARFEAARRDPETGQKAKIRGRFRNVASPCCRWIIANSWWPTATTLYMGREATL